MATAKKDEKEVSLDPKKVYTVIGTGMIKKGKAFLTKDAEYPGIPGADAELIINSGKATLKD